MTIMKYVKLISNVLNLGGWAGEVVDKIYIFTNRGWVFFGFRIACFGFLTVVVVTINYNQVVKRYKCQLLIETCVRRKLQPDCNFEMKNKRTQR